MLSISVVLYKTSSSATARLLQSVRVDKIRTQVVIVDNSPEPSTDKMLVDSQSIRYIFAGQNLGYGRAHNLAISTIDRRKSPYHLIVNPDVYWEKPILPLLVQYMEANQDVAQVMPKVIYPNGEIQYLCKLLPTPADLLIRRFLPDSEYKRRKQELFELRFTGYDHAMNVPYLSGCFMLLRRASFDAVSGFDERFFLYPEDIDLTRRLHSRWRTMFNPNAVIVHSHERASYKSIRMTLVHMFNLFRYFTKWGWFFDADRKAINHKVLRSLATSPTK